jgi:hypothetical protein
MRPDGELHVSGPVFPSIDSHLRKGKNGLIRWLTTTTLQDSAEIEGPFLTRSKCFTTFRFRGVSDTNHGKLLQTSLETNARTRQI